MRAMILRAPHTPLQLVDIPIPTPANNQVLIKVQACGVCRTDLHILDGELSSPKFPLVLGHQIVGIVEAKGSSVKRLNIGDRIGVPWLGQSCGKCLFCSNNEENLCDHALYTGYQIDGGFAEYCVADEDFCFLIPQEYPDLQASPLLCGGLIGFRALRFANDAKQIGFYGFGSSAHILIQIACYEKREVFVFTREGDAKAQTFAKTLGAVWTGSSGEQPPVPLDAALIFAPVGELVVYALKAIRKGGTVICAGIHMSDIPSFPYDLIWGERVLRSVANLTRKDGEDFFKIAPKIPVKTNVTAYPLEKANEALEDLRHGRFVGSAVIKIG